MSLFGDETITVDESPLEGQEEETAVESETDGTDLGVDEESEQDDQEDTGEEQEQNEEEESSPDQGQGDLILGKFKTQEDLAKAYQNLQREFTKQRQTNQQPPAQQPNQQNADQTDPPNLENVFWNNFEKDPFGTLSYLIREAVASQTAPIVEQRESDTLTKNLEPIINQFPQIRTEEGVSQFFDRINEIAQEMGNPMLAKNPSPRILRMAANELWGETTAQQYKMAKEKGRQQAEESRRNKQSVQANANKKPQKGQPKSEVDEIADSIVAAGRSGNLFG